MFVGHSSITPCCELGEAISVGVNGILCKYYLHHDDVIKWKHFPRYWPFVRGIHRSPVNSPHKGQWRGALMFTLIYVWINGCVSNRAAGDLRRYCAHYGVTVMCYRVHFACFLIPFRLWISNCYNESLLSQCNTSRIFYTNASAITHLPTAFLPSDFLWEYRIELFVRELPCMVFALQTSIFCMCISCFVTGCPCGAWGRKLTMRPCKSLHFCKSVVNKSVYMCSGRAKHLSILVSFTFIFTSQIDFILMYLKVSNIRRTKSQYFNDSHLVLQSSLPNPLKPGVKLRMKM